MTSVIPRALSAILPLALLLSAPLLLRPGTPGRSSVSAGGADRLVIITSHTETVRHEFGRAFRRHYREKYGVDVELDFRTVGGTSDTVRYIADRYEAEFRHFWEKDASNPPWSPALASAFSSPRVDPETEKDGRLAAARRKFLGSDVGIGIDIFWGGGTFDHGRQAERGFGVDGGVFDRHPEYFGETVIPQTFGGDVFYDPRGRYYGTCLAGFGICYNPDRVGELGDPSPPAGWADLGSPRFFNGVVVADPAKSGSANKCFETIIQQCMAEQVRRRGAADGVAEGWLRGFSLIKRIFANARSVTDSAGKVPRDIAAGNAAAGMAIDTYGLSEEEWSATLFSGKPKIRYVTPVEGTLVSADPVQLLRGARNLRAAREFLDYVLSVDGQKLWDYRAGEPGGPEKYSLRRPPIRRDLYRPEHRRHFADPGYNPYAAGGKFVYHGEWTGPHFNLIRTLIRCVALDVREELRDAWAAIIDAGGPEKVPEAMAEFDYLPFPYGEAESAGRLLQTGENRGVLDVVRTCRRWSEQAAEHYRRAAEIARRRTVGGADERVAP